MQNSSSRISRGVTDTLTGLDVTFEKSLIKTRIKPYTFNEARRVKGPIYDALVRELYEEGCPAAAHYLNCLTMKEIEFKNMRIIRDLVSDKPELLSALFQNIKMAERIAKENGCSGLRDSLKLLLDCVELLEPFQWKFDWLLKDVHKILTHIADTIRTLDEGAFEMMAQIYYKHGGYLNSTGEDMSLVIHYLDKALQLTRGHIWPADETQARVWGDYETLHQSVASDLTKALLKYGKQMLVKQPTFAIDLAQRAILIQAEVGAKKNLIPFCRAHIVKAKFLMENDQFLVALKVLNKVADDIKFKDNMDAVNLCCKLYLCKGICYSSLNDLEHARKYLRRSLVMSRKYNFKYMEADSQLYLSKLYSMNPEETANAEAAFIEAKRIYMQLGDKRRKKKILYLLAKLKADEIFPPLLDLIKRSGDHKCSLNHLRQWKNRCYSFFNRISQNLLREDDDEIYCVRDEPSEPCVQENIQKHKQ